jgi:hypothetical protein
MTTRNSSGSWRGSLFQCRKFLYAFISMNRTLQSISRLVTQSRGALEWTGGLATASLPSETSQSLSQNHRAFSHIRLKYNRWLNGEWQCEKKCHGGVCKRWGSTSAGGGQPKGPSSNVRCWVWLYVHDSDRR